MRGRLWTILGASTFVIAGASSCAQGSSLLGSGGAGQGGDGGAGPGPTGSTSSSGSTGASTTGTMSTTSTTSTGDTSTSTGTGTSTSSTTSTTSTGAMCSESPCKLTVPQCGCAGGEECALVGANRQCIPAGNVGAAQDCSNGDCTPGYQCIQTTPTVPTCLEFCDDDSDCSPPGGLCILTLSDGNGGNIPGVTLCTDNCNPISSVGCAAAGTSCQVGQEPSGQMRFLTFCAPAGNKAQYDLCDPSLNDCAPGYGCFNDGVDDLCMKYCDLGNGGACPNFETCYDIGGAQIGNTLYGVCY